MSLHQIIADKMQFISPLLYKERYFKKLKNLSESNVINRNLEPELVWIQNYLNKNSVILEIGANVGAYLYQLEDIVENENIYAFEPNRKLCKRLRRLFPGMHILPLALSDENKDAEFKIPFINGKKVYTRGTLQTQYKELGEDGKLIQKVKVIKLDDWAELEYFTRLDFIKIDVEGNEMQTLRGAKQTLKKFNPTLMVEMEQRHHPEPLNEMVSEIESWNYQAHYLNRESFKLQIITEHILASMNSELLLEKKNYINNIIFLPTV